MHLRGSIIRKSLGGTFAACATVALCSIAAAQSLTDSVTKAVVTHPRVGVVANNRLAVESELRRARGLWYPQVDVRTSVGPEWTNSPGTRAAIGADRERALVPVDGSLIIQQRVFDGWEANSEIDRQAARTESAARRVRETSEFVGLDAVEAHIDVVRQRRLVSLAETNVEVHRSLLARIRQRVAGGAGTVADVAQTQSRLDQAMATLAENRGALIQAEARYISIVGLRPGPLSAPEFPSGAMPTDVELGVNTARAKNPTVGITESDIRVADAQVKAADSAFYPKMNVELTASRSYNVDGTIGKVTKYNALFVMRWNLYRGGADIENRRQALGALAQAKSQRLVALRGSEEEMRRSYAQLESATLRAESLRSAVSLNRDVRDAYVRQFEVGQRSLLDVLDSENELFLSQSRLTSVESERVFAAYRILAVSGDLLPYLGVAMAPEADSSKPAMIPTRAYVDSIDSGPMVR
jgi:outer membrane protein, adhesin transport system